jgi:hypothetical protein
MTDDNELEELGNKDVTPADWEVYLLWCKYWNEAAEEQYEREEQLNILHSMVHPEFEEIGADLLQKICSRPLSSALEESYKNGFNAGQAEGLPLCSLREVKMEVVP